MICGTYGSTTIHLDIREGSQWKGLAPTVLTATRQSNAKEGVRQVRTAQPGISIMIRTVFIRLTRLRCEEDVGDLGFAHSTPISVATFYT